MKNIILLSLCMCFLSAGATSWRLNNNTAVDAGFRTFKAAHDAASAGDTIYVEGNGNDAHYGDVTISKKLIIIGPGYFLTENDSTLAIPLNATLQSVMIEATAAGTEIYGLTLIDNGATWEYGIKIRASGTIIARNFLNGSNDRIVLDANVQDVAIIQNFGYSVAITGGVTATNILIANNFFSDRVSLNNLSNAVIVNNVIRYGVANVYNSQIKNNIIYSEGLGDAFCVNNPGNFIAYNLTKAGLVNNGTYGPGNIASVNMGAVFTGFSDPAGFSTDGRWQLKPDGPAVGAGEGGIDCGMFGGSLPYVLSGLPAIPHIYEVIVPTAGSTHTGLPVIIRAKSQN
jgi:hypothetical protein